MASLGKDPNPKTVLSQAIFSKRSFPWRVDGSAFWSCCYGTSKDKLNIIWVSSKNSVVAHAKDSLWPQAALIHIPTVDLLFVPACYVLWIIILCYSRVSVLLFFPFSRIVSYMTRKAADLGDADAQYSVGVCYRDGWAVKQDDFTAVVYLRRAAMQVTYSLLVILLDSYYHWHCLCMFLCLYLAMCLQRMLGKEESLLLSGPCSCSCFTVKVLLSVFFLSFSVLQLLFSLLFIYFSFL